MVTSLHREAADILQTLPAEKRNSLQDLLKALKLLFDDSALRDYHRLQLKSRSQKHAESLQELVADIERLSLVPYPDCPPDVTDSLALDSFVDGGRDLEITEALRIADHKDLKSALLYAMKVEAAQQTSKIIIQSYIQRTNTERRPNERRKLKIKCWK